VSRSVETVCETSIDPGFESLRAHHDQVVAPINKLVD
jgi:hypothetical protein